MQKLPTRTRKHKTRIRKYKILTRKYMYQFCVLFFILNEYDFSIDKSRFLSKPKFRFFGLKYFSKWKKTNFSREIQPNFLYNFKFSDRYCLSARLVFPCKSSSMKVCEWLSARQKLRFLQIFKFSLPLFNVLQADSQSMTFLIQSSLERCAAGA